MKTILLTFSLFIGNILFAQQNEEFKNIKQYFDNQENLLKTEFLKRYKLAANESAKKSIENDFSEFMQKLDSIRNTAYLSALIKVKNSEEIRFLNSSNNLTKSHSTKRLDAMPEFPHGIDALREKVASLFYIEGINPDKEEINATVSFVVEKDGSITAIKAEGENVSFNKQAEIAMYLLPEKFSKPAIIKGNAVRYSYKMPFKIKFH